MSNAGHGGSYTINEKGERVLTEAPTADHPDGNGPRADVPVVQAAPIAAATETKHSRKTIAPAETIE